MKAHQNDKKSSWGVVAQVVSLSVALGLGVAGKASAAFISCVGTGYDISTKASTATDCTILSPLDGNQNDTPQPGFVNTQGFFGITNWLFDGKWDSTTSGFVDTSTYFNFTGGGPSGTYSYVGAPGALSTIMLLFKDGAGTNLVGYLIPASNGTYQTPFVEPPFPLTGQSTSKNVSHISVYYLEGDNGGGGGGGSIPEPATLLLMGAGLTGLAFMRRRKEA